MQESKLYRQISLLALKQFLHCRYHDESKLLLISFTLKNEGCNSSSSLKLGASVNVTLEGTVVDIGAMIVQVGHDWLVLGTVPLNVARLAHSVPVHILVVLMIDGCLSCAPFAVCIGNGRVLGEDTSDGPVEEVWVVDKSLGVEGVIVEDQWAVVTETTADTSDDEVADPSVGQPAANVEVLDGQFADHGKTQKNAHLSSSRIVSPVEVRLVSRSGDHAQVVLGEPALKHVHVVESFRGPLELTLLKGVF